MNIIVPMAGMGKRLRPHTLVTPKPLFPIAGKPIVQRLVEDIAAVHGSVIDEIAYIIGDFGPQVEAELHAIAERLGARSTCYYQEEPLGTAHALWCAAPAMTGPVVVAFADTLFRADFQLDAAHDGVIWVKSVEQPQSYGVVLKDENGCITELVEKPEHFVSDLAIIGIYYVKNAAALMQEIQYLLDHDVKSKGEYQLTDALQRLVGKGAKISAGEVLEWMDCGTKQHLITTNRRVLATGGAFMASSVTLTNAVIQEPCFIGENVILENAVIGPYVTIGAGCVIKNAVIRDAIIREHSMVDGAILSDTILGVSAEVRRSPQQLDLGDFSRIS